MAIRKGFSKRFKKFTKKTLRGFGFKGRGKSMRAYGKYKSPATDLIAAIKRAVAQRSYGDRKSLYKQHIRFKRYGAR